MQILKSGVHPGADDNEAIKQAADYGRAEVVGLF
jgi:hypothetical protein